MQKFKTDYMGIFHGEWAIIRTDSVLNSNRLNLKSGVQVDSLIVDKWMEDLWIDR